MNFTTEIISQSLLCILLCVAVFQVGKRLLSLVPRLTSLNLPVAVLGGIIFVIIFRAIEIFFNVQLELPTYLRDLLLVIFFCSMGLAVRVREALQGGKALAVLVALSITLVCLQNIVGVLVALASGIHPTYGLLAGSISYVGGFGSSLAWGSYFGEQGLPFALEMGFASSTLGLLVGGLLGGPAAAWIIRRKNIHTEKNNLVDISANIQQDALLLHHTPAPWTWSNLPALIKVAFSVALCIFIGDLLRPVLQSWGVELPRFLVSMLVAIVYVNTLNLKFFALRDSETERVSELSFNAFIIIALISMNFSALSAFYVPILVCCVLQVIVSFFFATEVIYRCMGKNYDAAVISGGVVGFGLSSLAVAVATVKTVTRNHGPSPKALLLTTLVGAALIDLPNNLLIGILSKLAFFQYP